jgi:hypothetical protein
MKIPEIVVPEYKTVLPVSKSEVSFRPFLVKEEKLLIMANESGEAREVTDAITRIVQDCTDGAVNPKTFSMFDMQYMFMQIRGKSVGETLDFNVLCDNPECDHRTKIAAHINNFTLQETSGHDPMVDLGNGNKIKMNYPNFDLFAVLFESDDTERIYDVVAACIDQVITPDEVAVNDGEHPQEFREFLDNLTPEQFGKLEHFFSTMPVLEYKTTFTCEACQTVNDVTIDGVRNFFE